MKIGVNVDTRNFEKTLSGWEKTQLPFATARALTQCASLVMKAEKSAMAIAFDRPTPYTMNSLEVVAARKDRLFAETRFRTTNFKGTPPSIFMLPQIQGGQRALKRSEQAFQLKGVMPRGMIYVPGAAAKLNAYGNIQPSLLVQILSATKAFGEQGYLANRTARSAKRDKKAIDVFVGRPGGGRLPLGVYQRTKDGVKPLLVFVAKAQYKARLPFASVAQEVYESSFAELFYASLRDALVLQPFLNAA